MGMVNWKRLYTDASIMLDKYQNEVLPKLREQLEKRVEVVRCKDCKFAYINNFAKVQEKALCNRWRNHDGNSVLMQADDFCSYGERREGE